MYANRSICGKLAILSPMMITFAIMYSEEWIFTTQFAYKSRSALKILVSVFYYTVSLMMITSLIACAIVDPGGVKTHANEEQINISSSIAKDNSATNQNATKLAYCTKCKANRPPRARHCTLCQRCVLKLDHHCPWVGNCIGKYNHKLFFLFCAYTSLSCFTEALALVPLVISIYRPPYSDRDVYLGITPE